MKGPFAHFSKREAACALGAVVLCGGVLVTGTALGTSAVSASDCARRNNDTERRLLECIRAPALWSHLQNLQKIANENPGSKGHGNRDTGTPGYRASVNYVANLMRQAGYKVRVQSYQWKRSTIVGTPRFHAGTHTYTEGKDWFVARLSGSGTIDAPLEIPRARSADLSPTGCSASDFENFHKGHVALLRRGDCDFDEQVANAQRAGASAVILYNGAPAVDQPAHRAHADGRAFPAVLVEEARIPVVGALSFAAGTSLAAQVRAGQAAQVYVDIHTQNKSDIDYNVVADSPYGNPDHVIVVEGHLDSIYGAGILDNGSGSATILEIARNLAHTRTRNRVRYIWFGGEEIGLLGSKYYTRALSRHELRKIAFDLDVDVTATPNFAVLIADPGHAHNKDKFPPNVVPDSQTGNRRFVRYFHSIGIPARIASFGNDGTDSLAFSLVGVPNSGILTQQNCCKHDWEVKLWGGFPGNFEGKIPGRNGGCVDWPRRWCDNLSNNDRLVLEFVSKAVAAVTLSLANDGSLGTQ
jgi:Zn-dependent M28 family amino/carboxypeptidase